MDAHAEDRTVRRASDEAMNALKFALSRQKQRKGEHHAQVATTLGALGKAHYKRGEYNEAVDAYSDCLLNRKSRLGNDHLEVADTLNRLGNVKYMQYCEAVSLYSSISTSNNATALSNSYLSDAMRYYQESLAIRRRLHGDGTANVDVAYLLENIGNVCLKRYKLDEAMENYTEALSIHMKIHGMQHDSVAHTLTYIGDVHKQRQEFGPALEAYSSALRVRISTQGEGLSNFLCCFFCFLLRYLESIIMCHLQLCNDNHIGRFSSLECLSQLDLYTAQFCLYLTKADIIESATILGSIADVYNETGEYDKSLEAHNEALRIKVKILGMNHVSVSNTHGRIGDVNRDLQNANAAFKSYYECLRIRKLRLRNRELDFANLVKDMNNVLDDETQQFAIISGEYEQTMNDLRKAFGEVANAYHSITDLHRRNGELGKALYVAKEEHRTRKLQLGERESEVIDILEMIAILQFMLGKFDDAMSSFKDVLRMRKLKVGQFHCSVALTTKYIGNVYTVKKIYDKALETYKETLRVMNICYNNKPHPQIANVLDNVASVYGKLEQFDKAVQLYQESLTMKQSFQTPSSEKYIGIDDRSLHADIASSLKDIGNIFYQQRKSDEAIVIYKEALLEKNLASEEDDLVTAEIFCNLGNVYYLDKRYDDAMSSYEESLRIKQMLLGDCMQVADTLSIIGNIHQLKGDSKAATEVYSEVQRIIHSVRNLSQ